MSLFLVLFLTVYGSMHVYAYWKARPFLPFFPCLQFVFILFLLCMVFTPILVHLQNNKGWESTARFTAYTGYTWMGFLLLFVSLFIMVDLYNVLIRLTGVLFRFDYAKFILAGKTSFLLLTCLVIAAGCYSLFDAQKIRTEKIQIVTSKLPDTILHFTIAQISDLHLGLIVRRPLLKKIISAVETANPDLLVSTGDLVDAEINHISGLAELFQRINPRYGKFAVTGNHDFYAGINEALLFTRRSGFKILRGEGVTVEGLFNIVGVDDPTGLRMGQKIVQNEKAILSTVPHNLLTILLKHRPDIDQNTTGLFDLQLSGHTHGGQIFPFRWVVRLLYKKYRGLHKFANGSFLYISTGTGTWGPPMRFLTPPKITIIDVVSDRLIRIKKARQLFEKSNL